MSIGRTIAESTPTFEPSVRPPAGAPNVVLVVLDDLGFAQLGCFGSDIATPTIDRLAAEGLRYNRFHVTSLCSPTRACLLTGRNHHAVGMGFLTEVPIGFPGYDGRIPPGTPTLPGLLRDTGYNTFAVGKWHLTPRWEQSPAGPFDRWPLGLGFDRFYGFLGGDTNQWVPHLVRDNGYIDPPAAPGDGYHVTTDLVDQAIRLVHDQQQHQPGKPFLLYLATGAVHAPHHVPGAWIERYRGAFDDGWDAWREATMTRQVASGIVPAGIVATERPSWVRPWDSLAADERRLFARMMEVFAGFLAHTDAELGRLVAHLEAGGLLDDTLLIVLSDNGASGEGGPHGSFNEHRFTHDMLDDVADTTARLDELGTPRAYNHYPWGWAWAGNAPFRLWKRYTWLGGVRTPLVVHWPGRLTGPGGIRSQFCHAVDVVPTVLAAVGVDPPAVLDGASLRSTFEDPHAPDPRDTQYFEMLGSRAIFHEGWKATTDHVGQQMSIERQLIPGSNDFGDDRWSLVDLAVDFAEAHDVAAEHPERLERMVALWEAEAQRNQVFPLDDSFVLRAVALVPSPNVPRYRTEYRPGGGPVLEDFLPPLGAGFELTAHVALDDTANGIVCALGDWNNGWALYLIDGRLVTAFSRFGALTRVATKASVSASTRTLGLHYERGGHDRPGSLVLLANGEEMARGELTGFLPFRWQIGVAGLDLGRDHGLPVCDDYEPPFPLTGTLDRVTIDIPSLAPPHGEGAVRAALRHE